MPKQVTSEEFYELIGPLDVTLEVQDPYPYKTLFRMRHSRRVVGYEGRDGKYYINTEEDTKNE